MKKPGLRAQLPMVLAVFVSLPVLNAGVAAANEYSCANAAAANGYVTKSRFLWQIQQDCAVAYGIATSHGISAQKEAGAAVAAAEQYLRSLGYDVATVKQMDIAGHGV